MGRYAADAVAVPHFQHGFDCKVGSELSPSGKDLNDTTKTPEFSNRPRRWVGVRAVFLPQVIYPGNSGIAPMFLRTSIT